MILCEKTIIVLSLCGFMPCNGQAGVRGAHKAKEGRAYSPNMLCWDSEEPACRGEQKEKVRKAFGLLNHDNSVSRSFSGGGSEVGGEGLAY